MLTLNVAGCALNQVPLDWQGNHQRILQALAKAKADQAQVVCLPELCITGYGCEDALFHPHVAERALDVLFEILPATQGLVVTVGLPVLFKGVLFNCSAMIANGELQGFVAKKSLAGDGVHYEPRWFKEWQPGLRSEIQIRGRSYPFGDLHFDFSGVKIGFEICEEAWVAHRPGASLARRAVDLILNPSASHFAFGKIDVRKRFVCEGSRAFNVAYVYSNLLGNEAGRIIYDGGVLIADHGELVAVGPRFSFQEVQVTCAQVDIARNRVTRARTASYSPELTDDEGLCIAVDFEMQRAAVATNAQAFQKTPWEDSPHRKEEEFTRAVSLGLFDFLRKSRQQGFVVSLSGGVDSAVVTLLCRTALDFAAHEIGLPALKDRLSFIPFVQKATSVDQIASGLITCAYQATKNSSESTHKAAQHVAQDAGATFYDWSVDTLLSEYTRLAEAATGEQLTWDRYDLTLQNIQARTRGPAIWMIANMKNALLLATSNRSEAAVGYATMDGDTCGGISPIGGIDKAFLRQWSAWMLKQGPEGLRPFTCFESVFAKPPTAELRPQDRYQTDEDDLMPYDVLDLLERLSIRDKKSPLECFEILRANRADLKVEKVRLWTVKFFRLWCRNQWKRERYAPAFHLDDESLDPKTWCRFPILSSGFEEEIRELESFAEAL